MSNQYVVVTESYVIEAVVTAPGAMPVAAHATDRLPWRQIRMGALIGGVLGLIATAAVAGIDSLPVAIACAIDIAAGGAIIGGLWGATFFSVDED
jgi:hypothetical protein